MASSHPTVLCLPPPLVPGSLGSDRPMPALCTLVPEGAKLGSFLAEAPEETVALELSPSSSLVWVPRLLRAGLAQPLGSSAFDLTGREVRTSAGANVLP